MIQDCITLIQNQVKAQSSAIAVKEGDRELSYADFWNKCQKAATILSAVKDRPKVLLDIEQSPEAYAAIVACLLIKGTYCPLSLMAPIERKHHIKHEFSPDVIVVDTQENKNDYPNANVIAISDLFTHDSPLQTTCSYEKADEDIIYIIYTSGSTGQPKGVQIARCGLNKFLEWSVPTYAVSTGDVWGQFCFLSFDLSIVDIFTCLCSGGTLLVLKDASAKIRPSSVIEMRKINYWHSVPGVVDAMIKSEQSRVSDISSLKLMSFCGEKLLKVHLDFLFSKNKNLRIFNTYGPTEGTLFCTWKEFNFDSYTKHCTSTATIGEAIPGWDIELIDHDTADEKEVVISGDFIGRGYLGQVDESKFCENKTTSGGVRRSFSTGDLVYKNNNELYFSSRKDRQVKFKGYRIEPAEIDYWVRHFLGVFCNTVFHYNALHTIIETNKPVNEEELRLNLAKQLESYKIPQYFITVASIPRNSNLKVDHAELIKLIP